MKKSLLNNEEKQRRLVLLHDFEQWRDFTGSNSRMNFAQERNLDLGDLLKCLKWYHGVRNRDVLKDACSISKGIPTLVPVTKKVELAKQTSSISEAAICIKTRTSSIDISKDIGSALLTQLLSTLGALNVL